MMYLRQVDLTQLRTDAESFYAGGLKK